MSEYINSSFTKIEHQEISFDDILGDFKSQNNIIKNVLLEEYKADFIDKKFISDYDKFFMNDSIGDDGLNKILGIQINEKKDYNISGNIDKLSEHEKVKIYSILSNLAYSSFKYESGNNEKKDLKVKTVIFDPLSFPNINSLFDNDKPKNLNKDEEFLYAYVNKNNDNFKNNFEYIADDVNDILRFTKYKDEKVFDYNVLLAQASINTNKNTMSDVIPENYMLKDFTSEQKNTLVVKGLEELRKQKIVENGEILEQLDRNFEVVDFFPKEGSKDKSGFGAICLKDKNGNKY